MADFAKAYQSGISNVDTKLNEKEEIDGVIQQLSDSINRATGGVVEIKILNFSGDEKAQHVSPLAIAPLIASGVIGASIAGITGAIQAYNRRGTHKGLGANISRDRTYDGVIDIMAVELAKFKRGSGGSYPCEITYGSTCSMVDDKESLEFALEEMLESYEPAKKLKELQDEYHKKLAEKGFNKNQVVTKEE